MVLNVLIKNKNPIYAAPAVKGLLSYIWSGSHTRLIEILTGTIIGRVKEVDCIVFIELQYHLDDH